VGTSTALAIGSTYPLWAALAGALLRGEPFGGGRAGGTLLCVGGVVALIRLLATEQVASGGRRHGLLLALATSLLWAGNAFSIKQGSVGLLAWQVNFVRNLMALPLLAAQFAAGQRREARPVRPHLAGLVLPALGEALIGSSLYVYALSHTDL